MRFNLMSRLVALAVPLASSADGITVVSDPLTVDFREDNAPRRVVGSTKIGYSAAWVSSAATSATKCVLVKSEHEGTEAQADVKLVETDSEGWVEISPDAESGRIFKVTMKAMNGTTEIGSVTREIAFGYRNWSEGEARADMTDDKLQRVLDEGALSANLECDTSWVSGAASAVLTQIRTPWLNKRDRGTPVQSTLANIVAPYDGYYEKTFRLNEGADFEFSLAFKDVHGEVIGEPYRAACEVIGKFGLVLTFR